MLIKDEAEKMKSLIEKGYDPELISFEFDIPLERIMQYKRENESRERKSDFSNKSNTGNEIHYFRLEEMRKRYKELSEVHEEKSEKKPVETSYKELEVADMAISSLERKAELLKNSQGKAKRETISEILTGCGTLKDLKLTLEQSERLNYIIKALDRENIQDVLPNNENSERLLHQIKKISAMVATKMARAILTEAENTEDIEELQRLCRKFTPQITRQDKLLIDSIVSQINDKIFKLRKQDAIKKIKNLPESIKTVVKRLADGTIDLASANIIIENETRKRMSHEPKNSFCLTQEQHRGQIAIQIKNALIEEADKYPITDPKLTIIKLQELIGANPEEATRVTIENLIARKQFEQGKKICDDLLSTDYYKTPAMKSQINSLMNKIKYAEIGDMVVKGLNMNGTLNEEIAYFQLIERGLRNSNVKLEQVPLGKGKNGRTIKLSDIWEAREERKR